MPSTCHPFGKPPACRVVGTRCPAPHVFTPPVTACTPLLLRHLTPALCALFNIDSPACRMPPATNLSPARPTAHSPARCMWRQEALLAICHNTNKPNLLSAEVAFVFCPNNFVCSSLPCITQVHLCAQSCEWPVAHCTLCPTQRPSPACLLQGMPLKNAKKTPHPGCWTLLGCELRWLSCTGVN